MMMKNIKNIIFIEDDELDYEVYFSILIKEFPALQVQNILLIDNDFYSRFKPTETLIFLDLNLKGAFGLDIYLTKLKAHNYTTCIHTSSDNPSDVTESMNAGIYSYFQKKIGPDEIRTQLLMILNFFDQNFIKTTPSLEVNDKYITKIVDQKTTINKLESEISKLRSHPLYPRGGANVSESYQDEFFIKLAKSFGAGIFIYNLVSQRYTYINSEYTKITNYRIEEINSFNSLDFVDLFHPDDINKLTRHMDQISKSLSNEIHKLEYRFKNKDGYLLNLISLDRVFERDSSGVPISFIGTFFEI